MEEQGKGKYYFQKLQGRKQLVQENKDGELITIINRLERIIIILTNL